MQGIKGHRFKYLILALAILSSSALPASAVGGAAPLPTQLEAPEPVVSAVPVRIWQPQTPPRGVVICFHGLALCSDAFHALGENLAKEGFLVEASDIRGFGQWMAHRQAHIDLKQTVADALQLCATARQAYPGLPVYLLGESLGADIVLRAAAKQGTACDGMICSAFPYKLKHPVRLWFLQTFGRALPLVHRDTVMKKVVERTTSNPILQQHLMTDQNHRLHYGLRESYRVVGFIKGTNRFAKRVGDIPTLVVQGSDDRLVDPHGARKFYRSLTTRDKDLVFFPGEHLLLEEELPNEPAIEFVGAWLRFRCAGRIADSL